LDTSSAGGYGVKGVSENGIGVYGSSNTGTGVEGTNENDGQSGIAGLDISSSDGHGTYGRSTNGTGAYGQTAGNGQSGVEGLDASTGGGTGVYGSSENGGTGVHGTSNTGVGVSAASTSGDALQVVGRVSFSTSGLATVAAHKKSVNVIAGVTASSIILATLQTDVGAIAVASAVPHSGSFRINLTAAPSRPVKVAWFVIG